MNILSLAKLFSISIILFIFAFLINNYLTFGGNWPGALSINQNINIYSTIQISLYLLSNCSFKNYILTFLSLLILSNTILNYVKFVKLILLYL